MPRIQKIIIKQNNHYLDSLGKKKIEKNYLDSLRHKERQIPIRIQLPLLIKNMTDTQFIKKNNRHQISSDGNFKIENMNNNITFKNVGGYSTVKKELIQIIDFLKNKEKYEEFGVRLPKGVLLEGPTGNGKTLMAKAFSGEMEYPIIATSGAEFNEKYVGVGAARIRELFHFAEQNQPVVIFIDEIDAVARKRSGTDDSSGDERSQTLNQLLVNLDGFNTKNRIIVMGATNRIDILDSAIIRPGRIDKIIHVPNPDSETRKEIIDIHRKLKPINVSTDEIVKLSTGLNGAQIENMLNEATLLGIRESRLPIDLPLLEETRNKMILGQSVGKKNITEKTLKRVAIHEIGHLLMALNSSHFEKPSKVTIDSSVFSSFGYTVFEQNDVDQGFFLREYCNDHLKVLLGGRVAEETIYGNSVSSGAFSDLETTFKVARKMIMEYGMGSYIIFPHFSETYKKKIDQEIHLLIRNAYLETKKYLNDNKDLLLQLSEKLLVQKTLYHDDFKI
jgi:cell division protease FtsH